MAKKKRFFPYYMVFFVIAVLLVFILNLLDTGMDPSVHEDDTDKINEGPANIDERVDKNEKDVKENGEEQSDSDSGKEKGSSQSYPQKPEKRGDIYLVIDDVGNSMNNLKNLLDIDVPITFAVMPDRTYTKQSAAMIDTSGKTIILHQPMEALDGADPGKSAIYTSMCEKEITELINRNLDQLPKAVGMNNHMGSKATADPKTMFSVLSVLKDRNMLFLDSYTTGDSKANEVSDTIGLKYVKRNALFLDNDDNKERIVEMIRKGMVIAEKDGYAILIGHIQSENLVSALRMMIGEIDKDGYRFVDFGHYNPEDYK